jgi:hypothetical protein
MKAYRGNNRNNLLHLLPRSAIGERRRGERIPYNTSQIPGPTGKGTHDGTGADRFFYPLIK